MEVKIACAQMESVLGDKQANLERIVAQIGLVVREQQPDIIVFPEMILPGYECGTQYPELAEPYPAGPSLQCIAQAAAENSVHVVVGFVEEAEKDGRTVRYNAAAFFDDTGVPIGCYRKSHLVEGVDTDFLEKGTEYPVFDTKLGKIGIMICWDTAYPEVARILALRGAEIIIVPACWEEPNGGDWDIVHMARSFDNVVYIAACNQVGTDNELTYFGKSKIVGPLGRTIVEAGNQEEVVCATVDTGKLPELREGYYVLLRDRNPKTYGPLLDETLGR